MAGKRRSKYKVFVPKTGAKTLRGASSGTTRQAGSTPARSTKKYNVFVREVPLPDSETWSGFDEHMPPTYTKGTKWSCPSCSCKPGEKHDTWCARLLFEKNRYDSRAYDDKTFLELEGYTKQIWFGEGHPVPEKEPLAEARGLPEVPF